MFNGLWAEIRRRLALMVLVFLACMGIAALVAFLSTPIYRAQVLLAPVRAETGGLGQMLGQFGGIAELAGLSGLGQGESTSALAVLRSRELGREFIEGAGLTKAFAARTLGVRWNWNSVPSEPEALMWDAYKIFQNKVRVVSEDRRTGLITVSFDWFEPDPIPNWVTQYVSMCNQRLRAQAIDDASRQLTFLRKQLAGVASIEVQQTINRLIEARLKEMAVAATRQEFAFKIVDAAVRPRERESPRRVAILLAGGIAGIMLCLSLAFLSSGRRAAGA